MSILSISSTTSTVHAAHGDDAETRPLNDTVADGAARSDRHDRDEHDHGHDGGSGSGDDAGTDTVTDGEGSDGNESDDDGADDDADASDDASDGEHGSAAAKRPAHLAPAHIPTRGHHPHSVHVVTTGHSGIATPHPRPTDSPALNERMMRVRYRVMSRLALFCAPVLTEGELG